MRRSCYGFCKRTLIACVLAASLPSAAQNLMLLTSRASADRPSIASITILDPDTGKPTTEVVVSEGTSIKPRLDVRDSNGLSLAEYTLTYTSLDTSVATVGPSGTIFGVRAGFSTLTISSGSVVATGTITVVAVETGSGGFDVTGIVQDDANRVYMAGTGDHTILLANNLKEAPTVYAGKSGSPGFKNDKRLDSLFKNPAFVDLNRATGELFVSDASNHAIRVVKAGADGTVETLAGSGTAGSQDGTGQAATFNNPQGVALDGRGNLWVVDSGNHTIRRINLSTRAVVTVAGKAGEPGSADGQGEGDSMGRLESRWR